MAHTVVILDLKDLELLVTGQRVDLSSGPLHGKMILQLEPGDTKKLQPLMEVSEFFRIIQMGLEAVEGEDALERLMEAIEEKEQANTKKERENAESDKANAAEEENL